MFETWRDLETSTSQRVSLKPLCMIASLTAMMGCVSDFPAINIGDSAVDAPTTTPSEARGQVSGQHHPDAPARGTSTNPPNATDLDSSLARQLNPDMGVAGSPTDTESPTTSPDMGTGGANEQPSDSVDGAGASMGNDALTPLLDAMVVQPMDPSAGGGPSPVDPAGDQADMMVVAPPAQAVCQFDWPAACEIDCEDEPDQNRLLHVLEGQERVYAQPQNRPACVLIEGRLLIDGYADIETDRLILGPGGMIDGLGRSDERGSRRRGKNGRSEHGRGGGGGGGSGECQGGEGASLTDGTNSANGGDTDGNLRKPGGDGGKGGDKQNLGGDGGYGGASLKIDAQSCVLAGTIDLSGKDGRQPQDSDGGGGGGGSSGQLTITCNQLEAAQNTVSIRLLGGNGGRGGAVSGYSGGGGGGGAGGRLELRAQRASVDGRDVNVGDPLKDALAPRVDTRGGAGGDHGPGGSDDERGERGEVCAFDVDD